MNRILALAGWTVFAASLLAVAMLCGRRSFAADYGAAKLPAEEEEAVVTEVPVHVGKISRATLHAYVVAYGTVEADPGDLRTPPASAKVMSPVAGIVSQLNCTEGQRVAKGATLIRLDGRVADVAVEKAKKALEFAELNFARQKKLEQVEGTSKKLYEEVQQQLTAARNDLAAAQAQRDLLDIKAPLSGTTVEVNVNPGQAVDLTTVLAELMDLDRLVVTTSIPSREIPLLKKGQRVEFSAGQRAAGSSPNSAPARASANTTSTKSLAKPANTTDPTSACTCTVCFIAPHVDPKTDTVTVRATVPPGAGLRLGQFVRLRVLCEERANRLVAPKESVVTDADSNTAVLAVVDGGKAIKRPVKVGLTEEGLVEVAGEGLKEGMTIVTEGAYGLPRETKIRVVGKQND